MRRKNQFTAFIFATWVILATHTTGQEVAAVGSTQTDQPVLNFDIATEPQATVAVEFSRGIAGQNWIPWTPPVTAVDESTPVSVVISDAPGMGFFRIVVTPPRVRATADDDQLVVELQEDGLPPDEVLVGLGRSMGQTPNIAPFYTPEQEETMPLGQLSDLRAGTYGGRNLEELAERLGWRLWLNAPENDDPAIAEGYQPSRTERGNPIEVPGDGGTGVMADGWRGDGFRPVPAAGRPLEPGQSDMAFDRNVPFDRISDLTEREVFESGQHVRVQLKLDGNGFRLVRAVGQNTGSGVLRASPRIPPEGWFVLIVTQFGSTHLYPFEDPRFVRAYDPPEGGAHGYELTDAGSRWLTVPVFNGQFENIEEALAGTEVRVVQVTNSDFGGLTLMPPWLVSEFPGNFREVYKVSDNEIIDLMGRSQRPSARAASRDPEVTTLHRSGSNGGKFNIAVIGEGFRDTTADQTLFNNFVENRIVTTLETRDIHPAILNGINLFRVNTFSVQSGVTRVNGTGNVTSTRSTALEYRYSGNWNRCWMEPGPNSQDLIDEVVANVCPQADYVIVVLNVTTGGGCARSSHFSVTLGSGWGTVAHEFGHNPGTLGDEYTCGGGNAPCGCYGGGEPGAGNLTRNTNRATLKWNRWVPPWRPLPTAQAQIASTNQDVGLFPGATIGQNQWTTCIFRPSFRGRMNNNTPTHNPVGYTNIREQFRTFQDADFNKNVVGDFNGDGRGDVVLQDGRQYGLFVSGDRDVGPDDPVLGAPPRGVTGVLDPTWFATDFMPSETGNGFWRGRPADILLPGDFDGDGDDDLYVINHSTWAEPYVVMMESLGDRFNLIGGYKGDLPGWERRSGDQFYVLDFDGDGRDDIAVFNGTNWSIPYLGFLRSTGSGLQMARRFDQFLPVWEMGRSEKFHVGDYNGDGLEDLIAFNRTNWAEVHLQVLLSTGNSAVLTTSDRYYGTIPNIWEMRRRDELHVLDFNADGESDIAIFNGRDWGPVYLAYIRSDEGELTGVRRHDNDDRPLPGWELERRDRFFVANVDGDEDDDLVVYNKDNWRTQYLGMIRSGTVLTVIGGGIAIGRVFTPSASWQDDWIGGWNLGANDNFKVVDFRGSGGWDDLFVFNGGWFGMLRSYQNHYRLETIYRKWIVNHRYHSLGWW